MNFEEADLELQRILRDTYRKGVLICFSVALSIGLFVLGVVYLTNYVKDAVIAAIAS